MGPPLVMCFRGHFDVNLLQNALTRREIEELTFQTACLFVKEPQRSEIVAEMLAHRSCHSLKEFLRFKLAHNVIVDFQQQPELIPLLHDFSVVKLCRVPCQCALERDRDVRRQRTEHLDVFGGKFLALQLCHGEKSISFLGGRDWKQIAGSSDSFGGKRSQLRMLQHFLGYVWDENWYLFPKHLCRRANS